MLPRAKRRLHAVPRKSYHFKCIFLESRLTEDCTSPTIVASELKKGNLEFGRHNYSIGTDLISPPR
jgi:hypothetical protein